MITIQDKLKFLINLIEQDHAEFDAAAKSNYISMDQYAGAKQRADGDTYILEKIKEIFAAELVEDDSNLTPLQVQLKKLGIQADVTSPWKQK